MKKHFVLTVLTIVLSACMSQPAESSSNVALEEPQEISIPVVDTNPIPTEVSVETETYLTKFSAEERGICTDIRSEEGALSALGRVTGYPAQDIVVEGNRAVIEILDEETDTLHIYDWDTTVTQSPIVSIGDTVCHTVKYLQDFNFSQMIDHRQIVSP